MAKLTITKTWKELAALDDNDLSVFSTPGSLEVYWETRPAFMYDECVATVHDFESSGIPYSREDEVDDVFEVTVELLPSRSF